MDWQSQAMGKSLAARHLPSCTVCLTDTACLWTLLLQAQRRSARRNSRPQQRSFIFRLLAGNGSEENTALLSWQDFAAGLFAEERQATPGEGLDNALPSQTEGNLFNGVTYNGTNVSTDPAVRPNNPDIARPVYRGGHGRSMASLAKPQAEAEAYQRSPQYQPSRLQYIEKPRWEGPH